ncbi:sensor histidine kinase [Paenibacillus sedimenti]|uniref:histidine kinase n=1 Tax=Paenibacillus sedimenti TaxID=2770274 RepID=A0A926KLZ2_9BACL|nr:sensor histidine kinase [Paenibacillus sedimenti]MBD0380100.1 sensor histidine kinase [Paenibacillus sedimenti]
MIRLLKMRSLKSKIILFFILFASIVMILQIGIFQHWIGAIILDKSDAYFEETVHQVGKRVELQLKQFNSLAVGMSNNQVMKNYLSDLKKQTINYNIAKYKISNEIIRTTNMEWIDNIYIFPVRSQPINLYYSIAIFEVDPSIEKLLNEGFGSNPDEVKWMDIQTKPPHTLSALLMIHEEDNLGLLKIDLNEILFSDILDEVHLGNEGTVYLTKDNIIIYAKDREFVGKPVSALDNRQITRVEYELEEKSWKIIGAVPQTEILHGIDQFNRIFMFMVILILAAIMAFAIATAQTVLRPLKKIMRGMESVQQGNLQVVLHHKSNDEFSAIFFHFNYMVDRVNNLIETIYQQQTQNRKAELLSLLSKLNPHFLYNSLDMIYWKAIIKGEEEIGGIIVALSNILRYSISHQNEFVTVTEDIEQLEHYLLIQRMRFEEKLRYEFQIQPDLAHYKIPKLAIQPLVENAMKYAFQDMKHDGLIRIRGYLDENDLIFEVIDNGVGMTEEKVRRLVSICESESEEGGLGIRLVHQRAKYIYGENYGIHIESAIGKGTTIRVRLGGTLICSK